MAMKGSSRIVRVLAPTLLVAAAGYIGMGCAPAAPTQVPPNNYFNPANNATLSSASVFEGRLALTSSSGPTFDLPWAPGSVFAVTDGTSSLGPLSGTGFVSPSGNFYFYDLEETANGNNPLLWVMASIPNATNTVPTLARMAGISFIVVNTR